MTTTNSIAGGQVNAGRSLTVIIVTYGGAEMVRDCLRSVYRSTGEVDELVVRVVDNNSPDDTPDIIEREFPQVILTRSKTNDGFAVANNIALRETSTDYCLLLNPDTVLNEGVIAHSIKQLDEDPTIGLYTCRLVTREGTFDHASKRTIPTVRSAISYFMLRTLPWSSASRYTVPEVGEREFAEVEAINGAFMLARMDAVRKVGLLDESYWMYGEDLDWCVRFAKSGRRVIYDGRVTAVHLKGGSSGRARSPKLNWHFHRSMWIFYRQHLRTRNHAFSGIVWCGIHTRMFIKIIQDQVRRHRSWDDGSQAPRSAERADVTP